MMMLNLSQWLQMPHCLWRIQHKESDASLSRPWDIAFQGAMAETL